MFQGSEVLGFTHLSAMYSSSVGNMKPNINPQMTLEKPYPPSNRQAHVALPDRDRNFSSAHFRIPC